MSSLSNGTNTVDSLAEVFRCFICMEKLSDARLCPHCSKLCCYPCIRRWLTDQHQQCPHCRATLRLHDLVNCRWAEEVTSQLDSLKINEMTKQKLEEKDKCELHKETLTVYCSSCSKCICHQCALFNVTHTGHHFLPLDDVYKTNISIINERLGQLKRRHVELVCFIQDIERNFENVKVGKDERFREIRNVMYTMQLNLDEQFKMKLNTLNIQRTQMTSQTEFIEHALHDVEHRLSSNGKAEVIEKQQDLLNSIQMVYEKSKRIFVPTPISYDFPSEVVPRFNSSIFIIRNFSILQQAADPLYSQSLHVNGLTWRLKIYPNGNGTVEGIYLSVFLELTSGLNESSKYEYRIEMIHQLSKDTSKNIIREFTSDFEIGECWGYNRYFLLNALISEGFHNTVNDTLILRFHVRPPTYQQESRDQQWYIKYLVNDNQQLNNEIKSLREKVLSLTANENSNTEINHEEENQIETVIDIADKDDDDEDEYTSIESAQMNYTDDDDDENVFIENDIGQGSNLSSSDQSLRSEQNIPEEYSHRLNEIPTTRSTILETAKSNSTAAYDSVLFNEISPFTSEENFILADILEHSANEEQNIMLHLNDNQPTFSSVFTETTHNNNNQSGIMSSEFLVYHRPHYETSFNNFILRNSQNSHSETSTGHD
ncbi:unnamed protein product [Rotaria socialis]|uniref:Uncharacterized protein n=1 Tax=Rotaria socialis TaxID=392032 RepID=A0A817NSV6_9BILA|nr:unnamed protein product [Rotaria socialis]CAF3565424.1 unnamed protein product [Rotaria socialis]CAF3604950.1 unnamed protein product [Rotaria socialis]CAF4221171.1 unnamed protein product [Rotaria socialis]CAF4395751.1 unnamed protein product [Rotaria socialis]